MSKEKKEENHKNRAHVQGTVSLEIEADSDMHSRMITEKKKEEKSTKAEQNKGGEDPKKSVPFYKLFVLADSLDIILMIIGTVSAVANGLSFPIMSILFGNLTNAFGQNAGTDVHKVVHEVSKVALQFVYLAVGAGVVSFFQVACWMCTGERQAARIRRFYLKTIIRQDIAFFDNEISTGEVIGRMSGDTILIQEAMGEKVVYEEASQVANDAVGSIRTVASFCAEDKVMSLYSEKCRVPLQSGIRQGVISGFGLGFSNFSMFSVYALSFWVGARMVEDGKTTFGKVFKVFFALTMAALGVSESTSLAPDASKVRKAVTSVFKILDRKSKIDPADVSGMTLTNVKGDIEFRHVSFKYPTRPDIQIFRDLCIFVHSGKTVALVGESGSGKSTVISLLERFYDPDSGHIFLDGIEIQKLQVKWLRQQMGLVSQEPILFNDTIRANIAYGKDGIISEEQIIAATEASNAHKFISGLPQGYNTNVGERGVQLSGGQKQRIAIARAILKDPRILLLDEATSALDAESERIVQDALDRVMVDRSTIVVAHRLSTIKDADLIAVVKNGVIVEQGKHEELLSNRDGAYATLVKLHMSSS